VRQAINAVQLASVAGESVGADAGLDWSAADRPPSVAIAPPRTSTPRAAAGSGRRVAAPPSRRSEVRASRRASSLLAASATPRGGS
jgi:hypothetical protein